MPKCLHAAALLSTLAVSASAQDAKPADPAPLQLTAQQDHKLMMEALKIESLRRGADGMNRNAPNAANYDESKANPYPNLPDPLILKNGQKVTAPEQWWDKRRPEIVEDFDREVYGRVPNDVPKVTWEVTGKTWEKIGDVAVVTKRLVGHVDNAKCPQIKVDIQLTLTTPADAKGPAPVMMEFGFGGFGRRPGGPPGKAVTPKGDSPKAKAGLLGGFGGGGPSWQQQVIAKGWGYAIIVPNSIQADDGGGLTKGIIGLCNKGQARKPDDWGALRAWAWGASRALDYFESDRAVDATRVGIEGISRYGKAALVAMAYDQRFAIGFIGSSGEGGAKLHRRTFGELVENLTGSGEYHWMAGNFLKYGGPLTPSDLPVDAHELIALCAPRPTFISYGAATGPGAEGQWVDQRGSFMAAVAAGPVFRLLGKKDLGTSEFPKVETGLTDGDLAFRQHKGGHTTGPNWPTFLAFADRYIKVKNDAATHTGHDRDNLIQEAIRKGTEEMSRLGQNTSDPKLPALVMHWKVALDGDTTTLMIHHQNQTKGMEIDLALNECSLGRVAPSDKLELPMRIGQLSPGATHEITLHYANVPWKLVDNDSAEVSLRYDEEWRGTIKGGPRKIEVRGVMVDLQMSDTKEIRHEVRESPVRLDAVSTQALKRRREAGRKGGKNGGTAE
jgi:hypothetical protein